MYLRNLLQRRLEELVADNRQPVERKEYRYHKQHHLAPPPAREAVIRATRSSVRRCVLERTPVVATPPIPRVAAVRRYGNRRRPRVTFPSSSRRRRCRGRRRHPPSRSRAYSDENQRHPDYHHDKHEPKQANLPPGSTFSLPALASSSPTPAPHDVIAAGISDAVQSSPRCRDHAPLAAAIAVLVLSHPFCCLARGRGRAVVGDVGDGVTSKDRGPIGTVSLLVDYIYFLFFDVSFCLSL